MQITKQHVLSAIEAFLNSNNEYPPALNTFLLYENKSLPAKHIRGLAYEQAFHHSIPKSKYSGGMETVNFFERLGFEVQYTGKAKRK